MSLWISLGQFQFLRLNLKLNPLMLPFTPLKEFPTVAGQGPAPTRAPPRSSVRRGTRPQWQTVLRFHAANRLAAVAESPGASNQPRSESPTSRHRRTRLASCNELPTTTSGRSRSSATSDPHKCLRPRSSPRTSRSPSTRVSGRENEPWNLTSTGSGKRRSTSSLSTIGLPSPTLPAARSNRSS